MTPRERRTHLFESGNDLLVKSVLVFELLIDVRKVVLELVDVSVPLLKVILEVIDLSAELLDVLVERVNLLVERDDLGLLLLRLSQGALELGNVLFVRVLPLADLRCQLATFGLAVLQQLQRSL